MRVTNIIRRIPLIQYLNKNTIMKLSDKEVSVVF